MVAFGSCDLKTVLPPSWIDSVPIASNVRSFLFHYTTHDFEAALLDFSLLSVELATAKVASSAGVARSFATKSGEAIFFSGKGTFPLASEAAAREGGKLITHTVGGKALNLIAPQRSPQFWQDKIWQWGSRHFAKGAHGEVRAFIRPPLRPNNTWEHVEYPILRVTPFARITPR